MSKYLVIDSSANAEPPELYEEEEAAVMAAEVLLLRHPDIAEVSVYKLHKTGKRQSVVAWDGEAKTNGQAKTATLPERPPYQGANKRWSDDEEIYLLEAKEMGMSFEGIAKKLGRTQHAVEVKYSRIGL